MNSRSAPHPETFRGGDPLRSASLRAAFARQEALAWRHLAGVHGAWGIVSGLGVCGSERALVEVEPGAAIDALGRWVTLDAPESVPVPCAEDDGGARAWLLVIRHGAPPRFVARRDAGAPGLDLVLARWDGRSLGFADRRSARPRGGGVPPRMQAGHATKGLPAIENDQVPGWSARVELAPGALEGEVAALVWPVGMPHPGASWSATRVHPGGFTFEAVNWPLPADPGTKAPIRELPVPLDWIVFEVGRGPAAVPPLPADGGNPMPASTRPVPAAPAAGPPPFAVPPLPAFRAGSTLRAEDLNASMARLAAVHALHNRTMHPRGIVAGLGVSLEADGATLRVGAGLAIDALGIERVLDAPVFVDPPADAKLGSAVSSILALAAGDAGDGAVLVWRSPAARTGPSRLVEGRDVVLARVDYAGGKVAKIDPASRRDLRPPDLRAGITPDGATEWSLWVPPDEGAVPKGVATFVRWPGGMESPGAPPVLLAQLVGDRVRGGAIVLDGPAFVASGPDAEGFLFVVAFPEEGAAAWGAGSRAGQAHLLDDLRHVQNWRVAWIAIGTDS